MNTIGFGHPSQIRDTDVQFEFTRLDKDRVQVCHRCDGSESRFKTCRTLNREEITLLFEFFTEVMSDFWEEDITNESRDNPI